MSSLCLVLVGGAVGATLRFAASRWIGKRWRGTFPLATFLINGAGSFALGLLHALYISRRVDEAMWTLFGIGLCGAFTTFSTFGVEAVTLLLKRKTASALGYVVGSAAAGLFFAWLGAAWYTGA
jgi:CrcB protein